MIRFHSYCIELGEGEISGSVVEPTNLTRVV